jgi:recombination associated protein RdgC
MWFKNIRLYPLKSAITISGDALETALASQAFTPCSANQPCSSGFVSALLDESMLSFTSGYFTTVRLQVQERVLPAAAVKETLEERVATMEAQSGRKLSARQKRELKEQIVDELMPRAFTKSRHIRAFWPSNKPWIAIDTATSAQAETVLNHLREALGSLPVASADFGQSPTRLMSNWATRSAVPPPWSLEDEVEWFDPRDADCRVRLKGWAMDDPLVQTVAERQLLVGKLRVSWKEALSATLTQEGALTRIRYSDAMTEKDDADHMEPLAARAHEFSVMASQTSAFLDDFLSVLQGP